ncbi:MAG TPA: hypothetical protein VK419_05060 [Bryobacteraceae bacterium]|nr:hypothetical protein [Bryobacteraceae bacterium]
MAFAVFDSPPACAQGYTINTIAGNNTAGYAGDGGPATSAELNQPAGLAVDAKGNLYIADTLNNVVRIVSGGNISTYAGDNTPGYTGDTQAAVSAELNSPEGLALDSSGNLYIADSVNQVIRKVATSGTITTYAGNNKNGAGYAGDSGAATNAQLNGPTGLALDSAGNLYIADSVNGVIRQVLASNQYIYSLAGAGNTGGLLNHPDDVVVDSSGALYITDTDNRRIVKYSSSTITTLAGNFTSGFTGDNGPALNAELDDPVGLVRDSAGNIYFADTFNNRIRRISPDGIITTIAGGANRGQTGYSGDGGPATGAQLNFPKYLAIDSSGNIYVSDTGNNVVRVLTPPPAPAITAGGIGNAASYATELAPGGLATMFGSNFSTATVSGTVTSTTPLATMLDGVTVSVNGVNAPILYLSPALINFQVPYETAAGSASILVNTGAATSNTATVPVLAALPGIFVLPTGPAVENLVNGAYSLNTPQNPAAVGSTIVVYLTGLGAVSPAVADGAVTPASGLTSATASASATIGSATANVSFTGLTPGSFGLGQMNIQVPASLAPGSYPLVVTVNGQTSNTVSISVH